MNEDFNDDIGFTDIDDDDKDIGTPQEPQDESVHIDAYFPNGSITPITQHDIDMVLASGFDDFTDFDEDDGEHEFVREDDVKCELAIPEADEALEKKKNNIKKIIIGFKEWVVELVHEGTATAEKTGADKGAIRTYTKEAEMPKITFAAPAKKMSFVKKLFIFLIACAGVGVFFGVKANSYFWFKDGKATAMNCAWSWLMEDNLPTVMSPIQSDVFLTGFMMGAGILGIIGLFVWLGNDEKRRSRVGHEHGNAQLGTKRDFAMHKRRFMD